VKTDAYNQHTDPQRRGSGFSTCLEDEGTQYLHPETGPLGAAPTLMAGHPDLWPKEVRCCHAPASTGGDGTSPEHYSDPNQGRSQAVTRMGDPSNYSPHKARHGAATCSTTCGVSHRGKPGVSL
jgi:hypothetical protein